MEQARSAAVAAHGSAPEQPGHGHGARSRPDCVRLDAEKLDVYVTKDKPR